MQTPLSRVFEAAGCRTQIELANLLGIRQSSISDAKKRNSVPAEWLVTLLRLRGVNPEWVLTGNGPKYLGRTDSTDEKDTPLSREGFLTANGGVPNQDVLRYFSSRDLADELLRRTAAEQGEPHATIS